MYSDYIVNFLFSDIILNTNNKFTNYREEKHYFTKCFILYSWCFTCKTYTMFIDRIVNKLSLYVHRLSQIYSAWCICTCQTTLQGRKSRQKRKVQQFLSLQLPVLTGTNRVSDTFITCVWRRKTVGQPKHLSFVHLGAIYKNVCILPWHKRLWEMQS